MFEEYPGNPGKSRTSKRHCVFKVKMGKENKKHQQYQTTMVATAGKAVALNFCGLFHAREAAQGMGK